jgi:hypothetical protein
MKQISLLVAGAMTFFTMSSQAQTVDEILSKHTEAIGGKEKLGQVKSLYSEITIDVMGNAASSTEYILTGKGYKSEVDFNGSKIVNCLNDKGGWSLNPMAGDVSAQAMPDAIYKASKGQLYPGGALVDYAAKGYKAELVGKEGNDFKIKISTDGNEMFYFVDPSSYQVNKMIVKAEVMGQQTEVITTFSDYKKTDFGIVLPHTRNVDFGQFQLAQKVNKVEVNKEIDPKMFDMPK